MNAIDSEPVRPVLVIDDEPQMRRLLREVLEANGYKVFQAGTGGEGVELAARCDPKIILLDLGLPDMAGGEVLKRIRSWSRVPVIILSVCDGEAEKIAALDAGANDYVTKPFRNGELLARVRTVSRSIEPRAIEEAFINGPLEINLSKRMVKKNGAEVKLTPIEHSLLRLFVIHIDQVLTHKQLLTGVWGPKAIHQTQYLRVHVGHLREKLEQNPSQPKFIVTEPAVGYRSVQV